MCDVSKISTRVGPDSQTMCELKKWKFGRVSGDCGRRLKPTLNEVVSRESSQHLRRVAVKRQRDKLVRLAGSKERILKEHW